MNGNSHENWAMDGHIQTQHEPKIASQLLKLRKTWISLEPVIDPAQSLHLIELTHEYVDWYGVGKLNHYPELERTIDWHKFRADAEALLRGYGKSYKVKRALKEASA